MTSAFVVPVAGYSTLVRLESVRRWPSTWTVDGGPPARPGTAGYADFRRGARGLVSLVALVALLAFVALEALVALPWPASSSSPFDDAALAVGWRVRAALASRTLASSAAIRSTTLSSAAGAGAATSSSPEALRSIRSRTWLR